jgi:hypothetical protein
MFPIQPRRVATASGIPASPLPVPPGGPAFARTRRAIIRLQAARLAQRIAEGLVPAPRPGATPPWVRLDRLTTRYRALGGDPARLAHLRGPSRRETRVSRATAARHERLAHQYEVGGSYSDLP